MKKTITGVFDGVAIRPDKPVKLPIGKRLRLQIEMAPPANGKKPPKRLKIIGTGKFDSGIADLSTNKKYLEGFGKS